MSKEFTAIYINIFRSDELPFLRSKATAINKRKITGTMYVFIGCHVDFS